MFLFLFYVSHLPLWVVLDSASATSVLFFFSSGEELLSIRSCLILGLISSPSSNPDEPTGEEEARRLGVEDAAPSTISSPGAGNRGDVGGVCTLLPVDFLPDIGADMLGLLVFMVDNGNVPSSLSLSLSLSVKQWPKFSLLQEVILCWMKRTMSERANGFWQAPQVRMSWWPSGSAPSASAVTKNYY